MSPTLPAADPSALVALFLFSLAVRPLPAALQESDFFQIDRAEAWKLAAASLPVGRNTFHALTVSLAEETDAITVDRFVGNNRRFIRLASPAADEYPWLEEALVELEPDDLDAAISMAAAHGFDTTTPLPAALVLPVSQGASERAAGSWDDDEDADEVPEKTCTKCSATKALTEFPTRTTGRLSSWCTACHRAATADWRRRHPGYSSGGFLGENGENGDTHAKYALRSPEEVQAAMPKQKHCRRCRKTQAASAFNRDSYKRDGLSVYCKFCRYKERQDEAARVLLNPPTPRGPGTTIGPAGT
jgi:hypothetical protein